MQGFSQVIKLKIKHLIGGVGSRCFSKMTAQMNQKVAVCQMRATNDKDSNLGQVKNLVEKAKNQGATFVFLPECCDFVGENRQETLRLSETLFGNLVEAYKSLARSQNVWLSLGGLHEISPDAPNPPTKIHNCHVIIDNCGQLVASYRKLHMFDVDTSEFRFRESEVVAQGPGIVMPIDTPIGLLGLQICYDVRFPEVSGILRSQGAQILTYPSAFAYATGLAHWETLLKSRAIENQCYVIAAAQMGFHNKKRRSYGHAMIVDPWGQVLVDCEEKELEVAVIDVDLDKVASVRRNMPCEEHRKMCENIYSRLPLRIHPEIARDFDFGGFAIPKATVFYESAHSFAFTNIRCVVPGHCLIATKRPAKRLSDLTPEEIGDFFNAAVVVQKVLESFYSVSASNVTVQDGKEAGQTVAHVHCHILPRREGDFSYTDKIYSELRRHDSAPVDTNRRPLEEMVAEAEKYRQLLKGTR
ncbi:nitrilase and fragile histidine triad fusion protein NitFhit [Phlebotomus argentipes]|uniref:nitrilase and fragile histidine triad fusion protein NitFhit n=1 Tax=Phlebotomus argentipes TaxID=94469 RepID=UPI002892A57C|nr:nitrilase and fragile histidine triad fusion protein NitFhit [Phlebotomus argentipes]